MRCQENETPHKECRLSAKTDALSTLLHIFVTRVSGYPIKGGCIVITWSRIPGYPVAPLRAESHIGDRAAGKISHQIKQKCTTSQKNIKIYIWPKNWILLGKGMIRGAGPRRPLWKSRPGRKHETLFRNRPPGTRQPGIRASGAPGHPHARRMNGYPDNVGVIRWASQLVRVRVGYRVSG